MTLCFTQLQPAVSCISFHCGSLAWRISDCSWSSRQGVAKQAGCDLRLSTGVLTNSLTACLPSLDLLFSVFTCLLRLLYKHVMSFLVLILLVDLLFSPPRVYDLLISSYLFESTCLLFFHWATGTSCHCEAEVQVGRLTGGMLSYCRYNAHHKVCTNFKSVNLNCTKRLLKFNSLKGY